MRSLKYENHEDIIKHTIHSYLHNKLNRFITHHVLRTSQLQEAPDQDDDFVGLQVVLHIDPNVINDSLADVHSGGKEVDRQLLDQTNFGESNEDEYITSESKIESDFNDIDTS
ncbi:hypothetical protein CR513_15222, partial [Mucuna pruriens]